MLMFSEFVMIHDTNVTFDNMTCAGWKVLALTGIVCVATVCASSDTFTIP